jgi:spermidine/putrescine transport system ATP-binding protein
MPAAEPTSQRPPAVRVENLCRRFGSFTALDHVSLTIRQGEFFSLLGPSGCGKTTLLRLIAGLDLADEGVLEIGGVDMHTIAAHRRPVNTVFQSYALFPHLSVRDNVAFGLRMKKVAESEVKERTAKTLELVRITQFADRKPAQLSGGQKQRVALARALVNEPQVLLLDEPLGALDMKLRKELQVELLALQRRLGITFIFVTHDQEEALVMSDRIAVMRAGRIEQLGEADKIYERPKTRFASQFLGSCTLLDAKVESRDGAGAVVTTQLGRLRVELGALGQELGDRAAFTLAIRPEKVTLQAADGTPGSAAEAIDNRVAVTVRELIYIGSQTHYLLDVPQAPGLTMIAYAMNSRVGSQGFDLGQRAVACLPPSALVVLED